MKQRAWPYIEARLSLTSCLQHFKHSRVQYILILAISRLFCIIDCFQNAVACQQSKFAQSTHDGKTVSCLSKPDRISSEFQKPPPLDLIQWIFSLFLLGDFTSKEGVSVIYHKSHAIMHGSFSFTSILLLFQKPTTIF